MSQTLRGTGLFKSPPVISPFFADQKDSSPFEGFQFARVLPLKRLVASLAAVMSASCAVTQEMKQNSAVRM